MKKMRKIQKIVFILMIVLTISFMCSNISFADNETKAGKTTQTTNENGDIVVETEDGDTVIIKRDKDGNVSTEYTPHTPDPDITGQHDDTNPRTPTPAPTPKKSSNTGKSSGTASTDLSWDRIHDDANNWLNGGKPIISGTEVVNKVLPIGQMLTAIGIAIVFGGILILGIKYMISEPEQKGKLKQQLIGLVVSGVVIFGAYTIWNLFYNFFKNIFE